MNNTIKYRNDLREKSQELRKNQTFHDNLLWQQIKSNKLGVKFRRQVPIDKYIVDFMSKEVNLIIEVDGESHDHQIQYDSKRDKRIRMFEFNILRFDNKEIEEEIDNVIFTIKEYIKEMNN